MLQHRPLCSAPAACTRPVASLRAVQCRHQQARARALCARPTVKAAASKSKELKPLLENVVEITMEYIAETDRIGLNSSEALQLLLEEQSLLARPGLYAHINENLQELKVRTMLGPEGSEVVRDPRCGISFVDPRCPQDILHPADRADTSGAQISSEAYIRKLTGQQLKYPKLFCVAVLHKRWQADTPDKQQQYKTWPLECCWCYIDKRKKAAGEHEEWRLTDIAPGISARVPPWIADCFSSIHAEQPGSRDSSSIGSTDSRQQPETKQADPFKAQIVAWDAAQQPVNQIVQGLGTFAKQIYPTHEETARLHAVTAAVRQVLPCISRSEIWQVAGVLAAGSFVKKTSLSKAHDLDLLVDLETLHFERDRMDCLDRICAALCSNSKANSGIDPLAVFTTGWTVRSNCNFLRLHHPTLNIDLDVQVRPFVEIPGKDSAAVCMEFLKHFFLTVKRVQQTQASPDALSPCPEGFADAAYSNGSLQRHWQVDTDVYRGIKGRAVFGTPLLTVLIKGAEVQYRNRYNLEAAGDLVTTVIRFMKAWTKYGLHELQPPSPKFPGCIWEIVVVYVLQQQCALAYAEGGSAAVLRRYGTTPQRRLNLFLDVLQCAAECFGPAGPNGRTPIALTDTWEELEAGTASGFYTVDELEVFRETWGRANSDTPWIIHPADPSNNCARYSTFGNWGLVAQEAGKLHQQLQQLRQGSFSGQQLEELFNGQQLEGVANNDGVVGAWQVVLEKTTLGQAVKEVARQPASNGHCTVQ